MINMNEAMEIVGEINTDDIIGTKVSKLEEALLIRERALNYYKTIDIKALVEILVEDFLDGVIGVCKDGKDYYSYGYELPDILRNTPAVDAICSAISEHLNFEKTIEVRRIVNSKIYLIWKAK